ncbi:MAG TPA: hypothetical protein VD994_08170, partial [Prosthecobacter sp.]|nr:hypothetical protein [Prosthecobacter sp.]
WPLLLEYALDLNPHLPDTGILVPALENERLHLTYPLLREDLNYVPETSVDLRTWTTEGVTQTADAGQVTASVPASAFDERRFLRLRVASQ